MRLVIVLLLGVSCASSQDDDVGTVEQALPPTCGENPSDPCCSSPIIIDVAGDGFALTNAHNGVHFDMNANGILESIAWTAAGSDDAWLALDRNGNGSIDDGSELFGNFTAQGEGSPKHGYRALAVFDENADGLIDSSDRIFASLWLWQDRDRDGVSDSDELASLASHGITGLDLNIKILARTDEFGNVFNYAAKVFRARGSTVGPKSYDVFLTRGGIVDIGNGSEREPNDGSFVSALEVGITTEFDECGTRGECSYNTCKLAKPSRASREQHCRDCANTSACWSAALNGGNAWDIFCSNYYEQITWHDRGDLD